MKHYCLNLRKPASALFLAVLSCGCTTVEGSPLIFGQALTVGISAGTAVEGGNTPKISVGLDMIDIAIVPTIIPITPETAAYSGADRKITANVDHNAANGTPRQDALSTFGSFKSDTTVNQVQLGVFFSTGVAAQNLSDGFKCSVGPNHKDCTNDSAAPEQNDTE